MINDILKVCKKKDLRFSREPHQVIIKATEELGEVASSFLKPFKTEETAIQEIGDMIVAVVDAAHCIAMTTYGEGYPETLIHDAVKRSILKWGNEFYSIPKNLVTGRPVLVGAITSSPFENAFIQALAMLGVRVEPNGYDNAFQAAKECLTFKERPSWYPPHPNSLSKNQIQIDIFMGGGKFETRIIYRDSEDNKYVLSPSFKSDKWEYFQSEMRVPPPTVERYGELVKTFVFNAIDIVRAASDQLRLEYSFYNDSSFGFLGGRITEIMNKCWDVSKNTLSKRLQVGACAVDVSTLEVVVSQSFNQMPPGSDTKCCELEDGTTNPMVIHAEIGALNAYNHDVLMFCTDSPCYDCALKMVESGRVQGVIYEREYRLNHGLRFLYDSGIPVYRFERETGKLTVWEPLPQDPDSFLVQV